MSEISKKRIEEFNQHLIYQRNIGIVIAIQLFLCSFLGIFLFWTIPYVSLLVVVGSVLGFFFDVGVLSTFWQVKDDLEKILKD